VLTEEVTLEGEEVWKVKELRVFKEEVKGDEGLEGEV
jgi:hypothetical protein